MWFIWLTVFLIWFVLYMVVGVFAIAFLDIYIYDEAIHDWLASAPYKWMADIAIILWPLILIKIIYELYKQEKRG